MKIEKPNFLLFFSVLLIYNCGTIDNKTSHLKNKSNESINNVFEIKTFKSIVKKNHNFIKDSIYIGEVYWVSDFLNKDKIYGKEIQSNLHQAFQNNNLINLSLDFVNLANEISIHNGLKRRTLNKAYVDGVDKLINSYNDIYVLHTVLGLDYYVTPFVTTLYIEFIVLNQNEIVNRKTYALNTLDKEIVENINIKNMDYVVQSFLKSLYNE